MPADPYAEFGQPVKAPTDPYAEFGSPVNLPNAGLAPPAGKPNPSLITNAPEESGLETGPLVSYNPAENDTLKHGAGSARALAREVNAAGHALNPAEQIPNIFHAVMDPQTKDELPTPGGVPPVLSRALNRMVVQPTMNAISDYATGKVTPEAALENAPAAIGGASGAVVGGKLLDSALSGAPGLRQTLLPTTEEAGKLFQPIEAAAKNVPVKTDVARAIAEEAKQYADKGATLPKVLKNFLSRTEATPASFPYPADPAPPVLYPESRLFAQNAGRLSAAEQMAANPNMQRLVGKFANALKETNRAGAEEVGMGAQYDQAMKTYAGAANRAKLLANLQKVAENAVVKGVVEGVGLGTGGLLAYKALSKK